MNPKIGHYKTIYADPPWVYDIQNARRYGVGKQYQTTSTEEIGKIPVAEWAHPDGCILWMWTTWPKMRDGEHTKLLDLWGFKWKSEIIWDKRKMGIGYWIRKQTEILLVCSRGEARLTNSNEKDLISICRGKHSEKPWQMYDLIERNSEGPYLELFARTNPADELFEYHREGWDHWGNEA